MKVDSLNEVHVCKGEGEPMKIFKAGIVVVISAVLGSVSLADYVGDNFDSDGVGAVHNVRTWKATDASVVITNADGKSHSGANAVMIPTLQTVSNAPSIAATRVWTDFWTIPRPFVSSLDAAPYVEPSASAQFFISNTAWAVMSGTGGTTVRTHTSDWANTNITVVNDESTWYHVSVLHDYNTNKWVLFVNGGPVSSNCVDFMASVSGYGWFAIENGGGDSSNRTWLDDVLITNRIPASLTRDDDGDTMLDAWELMYFSDLGAKQLADAGTKPDGGDYTLAQESYLRTDPTTSGEPAAEYVDQVVFNSTNAGIQSLQTNGASGMRLGFSVGADRTYRVLHSVLPSSGFQVVGSFYTGPAGETNWWVHTNALSNVRGFYMLNAEAGPLNVTNDEVYTFFWQSRQLGTGNPGSNFWVGVVVDYGASNTLASTLGQQLAQGLNNLDLLRVFYGGETTFRLESGEWVKLGTGPIDTSTPIPLGVGMVISRADAGNGKIAVMSGRMITSNSISLTLPQGWNMIAWPFEGSNDLNVASSGLTTEGNAGDFIWIYRNGAYKKLRNQPSTISWLMSGGGTIPADVRYLRFGEGIFYSNTTAELTWSPTD